MRSTESHWRGQRASRSSISKLAMIFGEPHHSCTNSIHLQIIKKAVNSKRHRAYTVRVCAGHRMG
jgi:hypothetical protein